MADENTPIAPTSEAPAPEASVATPELTNSPSEGTTAETSEISAEQVAKYLGTDVETFEKFNTFVKNNGQFDGAFKRMKDAISRPPEQAQAVTQPEAPQAPVQPQMTQAPSQAPEAPQNAPEAPRAGTYSMEELAAQTYFERLANDEKYANIADEIRTGKVLEGLKSFNITPITDGRVNDADIRKYLDLYAATKPAKPTSSEPTASPSMANDISNITKVTTREEADRIQLEDIRLRAAGQPGHPLAEEAKKFVANYYKEGLDRKRR